MNLYKTLLAEAKYAKEDSQIYTIALDLSNDANARDTMEKVSSGSGYYFSGPAADLEGQFKDIAQKIQMPYQNLQTNDPMGTGFSLVAGSGSVSAGTTVGLDDTDPTRLLLNMSLENFTYNQSEQVFEANVKYKIQTNVEAVGLLQDSATGELPTNKDAVFTYTENNEPHEEEFPVPVAKPTILAVTKDLYEVDGQEPIDLNDEEYQREYHYSISGGTDGLTDKYIDDNPIWNYHIFQDIVERTVLETYIINDDIARFLPATYRMETNAGVSPLENGKFTLVPETGLNYIHIENIPVENYLYDDFGITKEVTDANGNTYAELDEFLHYTVTIENTKDIFARFVNIKDTLSEVKEYLQDFDENPVTITRDGLEEEMDLTVADLVAGFEMMIGGKEVITVSFDVQVKKETTLPDFLNNTVTVNEKDADGNIETALDEYIAKKTVVDYNDNNLAEAGEELTYTISVNNTGKVDIYDVVIKDNLVNIIDHIQEPTSVGVKITGHEDTYTLAELKAGIETDVEAGETVTAVFSVRLLEDFNAREIKKLTNVAHINELEETAEIETGYYVLNADKFVDDANDNGKAEAGESLSYTIRAWNTGKIKAKDIEIKDELLELMPYINDPESVIVYIGYDEFTLVELATGILVDIDVDETVEVKFDLMLKEDFDAKAIKTLRNDATVETEKVEAVIPTGYYEMKAEKFVKDANGDGYAEAGEALTYTIKVENTGNVLAEGIMIQDDLANLVDHLKDHETVKVQVGAMEYSLEDLMNGMKFDIEEDEILELVFTVVLKENFNAKAIKVLMNIAKVDDLKPEAQIDTYVKKKAVLGAIKPPKLVLKDRGVLGVTRLPYTGQSNQVIFIAAILVLIGIGLVVKKREEDE